MTDTNPLSPPPKLRTPPRQPCGWPAAVLATSSTAWGIDTSLPGPLPSRPDAGGRPSADTTAGSFSMFKPVGNLMVGLPLPSQLLALVRLLRGAGWPASMLLRFDVQEAQSELQAVLDGAGVLEGFSFEITLLRRYLNLSREGYGWLLVRAEDARRAQAVAALARKCGARVAVHYRAQGIEELIA
jgi:hypothetical protein